MQVTLQLYDPALSSSDTVLGCTDPECTVASERASNVACTSAPSGACSYSVVYGDKSTTQGYIINDVLTYQDSATTIGTATIFFG